MRLAASLIVLLIVAFAHGETDLTRLREDPGAPQADVAKASQAIVDLTNAFRKEQGLAEVKVNERLQATSKKFAEFMAKELKYGHEADGKTPADRATASKYDYALVLENIAYHFSSDGVSTDRLGTQFTTGWQNSPGHRKNMLDPDVTETGVAIARSEGGIYFAVQMFGRPKSAMFEITIMNKSRKPIEYTLDGEPHTLRARAGRSHGMARPPTIAFKLPAGSKQPDDSTLKPTKATTYTITDAGDGVAITVR